MKAWVNGQKALHIINTCPNSLCLVQSTGQIWALVVHMLIKILEANFKYENFAGYTVNSELSGL